MDFLFVDARPFNRNEVYTGDQRWTDEGPGVT